jgi:hypothetical protein
MVETHVAVLMSFLDVTVRTYGGNKLVEGVRLFVCVCICCCVVGCISNSSAELCVAGLTAGSGGRVWESYMSWEYRKLRVGFENWIRKCVAPASVNSQESSASSMPKFVEDCHARVSRVLQENGAIRKQRNNHMELTRVSDWFSTKTEYNEIK